MRSRLFFLTLFLVLLLAHLCHSRVLWAEETLPLSAAGQMLHGRALYRDIWFDKPPFVAAIYVFWGARIGTVLRFFGALYVFTCCVLAWFAARRLWGDAAAYWSAALLGFALTFNVPSAVVPLAADLLLVWVGLMVLWAATPDYKRTRALLAGMAIGLGLLTNTKAVFLLAAAALFSWPVLVPLLTGVILPMASFGIWLAISGAWPAFVDQVLVWPSYYASSSHVSNPLTNGLLRTANWTGFHCALAIAACAALARMKEDRWKWVIYLALAFVGVALGSRFFPRYFFLLLPPVALLAGRGFSLLRSWPRGALLLLLAVPLIRFGPRYPILAFQLDPNWSDLAMDTDSREAALVIKAASLPTDTLYVWGYRPELFAYTRLPAASRYLDCQAMTGVPADRHLSKSESVLPPAKTAAARRELAQSTPDFLVDGLSLYNPRLSISAYPELVSWFSHYKALARTRTTIIYKRTLR